MSSCHSCHHLSYPNESSHKESEDDSNSDLEPRGANPITVDTESIGYTLLKHKNNKHTQESVIRKKPYTQNTHAYVETWKNTYSLFCAAKKSVAVWAQSLQRASKATVSVISRKTVENRIEKRQTHQRGNACVVVADRDPLFVVVKKRGRCAD